MTSQIAPEYQEFLEKLVVEKHGEEMPDKLKEDMIIDLYSRLLHHLFLSYMQALPDESAEAFEKMMDSEPDSATTQQFLQDNIPNLDEVTVESLHEFRGVYLG